ncbi:hypothetical protein GOP47_0028130 [Adiantum capillus-veneris]|nr:hypothetical protein GOP47_0028130 [Adiantum capillus-veneris]
MASFQASLLPMCRDHQYPSAHFLSERCSHLATGRTSLHHVDKGCSVHSSRRCWTVTPVFNASADESRESSFPDVKESNEIISPKGQTKTAAGNARATKDGLGIFDNLLRMLRGGFHSHTGKQIPEAKGDITQLSGAQPFFIFLNKIYLQHGNLFRLKFGPKSFLIVSDPSMAKHILKDNSKAYSKGILAEILEFVMGKGLIPAEHEVWRVRRRAIVPALHLKYVAEMVRLFGRTTESLCSKLDIAAHGGSEVEMELLFSRLTLDIIGKAVFNYDFDSLSHDKGLSEAVYVALRESEHRSLTLIPYWNIPIIKDLSPRQRKVRAALTLLNETLDELIARCKRMTEEKGLSFGEDFMNNEDPSILQFLLASGEEVTNKQLKDDLMTMLIAGHETSAAVLTWAFYLLAKNTVVMAKLQEEVDHVLGDRLPTIEDLRNLKLTRRVINETLRLYPEPPVLIRRALQDDKLGSYPIQKGEDIFISVWNLHRSPLLWEDADEFRPERWPVDGPDPTEVTENYRYLPFGGGPRKCVGDMFATFETMTAVAMLVRRFNFKLAEGAPPVGMVTGATIHTSDGLRMTVSNRMMPKNPLLPKINDSLLALETTAS